MPNEPGAIPRDEPLAYYLTWTTYASWLPGDERGWVAKPGQFRAADPARKEAAEQLMTEPPLTLRVEQRAIVEKTIADHCRIRGWKLHVVNCRTQHVHVVVTAPNYAPEVVRDQFKAWCTRRLKERERSLHSGDGVVREKWWTQGGSTRWLNDPKGLEETIIYVRDGQGDPTPHPEEISGENTQA